MEKKAENAKHFPAVQREVYSGDAENRNKTRSRPSRLHSGANLHLQKNEADRCLYKYTKAFVFPCVVVLLIAQLAI